MTRQPETEAHLEALYPIGETAPERVTTRRGRPLAQLTLENLQAGQVVHGDLGITAEGLRHQAAVARSAGRPCLARNFERGAELVAAPDELILEVYELLRPGRAKEPGELTRMAMRLRREHGAERVAALVEEAAEVYRRRGLFRSRF
jgi:propanediol dehydratase small subunit